MITLRFHIKSLSILFFVVIFSSCNNDQENATQVLNLKMSHTQTMSLTQIIETQVQNRDPYGSIRGRIYVQRDIWDEDTQLSVFTSNFFKGSSDQDGFFLYDSGTSKQVNLEKDGTFELSHIVQGDYVILIGPTPEYAKALTWENGETMVIHVEGNRVTDIGTIQISD